MTTKDRIREELENLTEEDLSELLRVIQSLTQAKTQAANQKKSGLLSKLKQVKIDAPEDFAANLDQYLSGEKRIAASQDIR